MGISNRTGTGMQVRSLPGLIPPQLPTNTSTRAVTPVPAQDERSQPSALISRQHQAVSDEQLIQARQNQRYSYTKINADGSKASQALQTYFDIQTQDEQERSQAVLGIDVHA